MGDPVLLSKLVVAFAGLFGLALGSFDPFPRSRNFVLDSPRLALLVIRKKDVGNDARKLGGLLSRLTSDAEV